MLLLWEGDLTSARGSGGTTDEKGNLVSMAQYNQTVTYLNPMMEKLKDQTFDRDMSYFLSKMVIFCLQGEYIEADKVYMQLSIGNAPWPIGVTMVSLDIGVCV
eukprot:Awhi_evm1s6152